jgi:long-subunit acyl-CoA synthetase (AMP-forming)
MHFLTVYITCRLLQSLLGLGLAEGETVCLWASNLVEYWLVGLAAWEVGAAIMPLNCLIHLDKLVSQLVESRTVVLVCDELNAEEALLIKPRVASLKHILLLGEVPVYYTIL